MLVMSRTTGFAASSPALVLFWSPGCGFCSRMLDDLKAWKLIHRLRRTRRWV
jgi:hypothetical protein